MEKKLETTYSMIVWKCLRDVVALLQKAKFLLKDLIELL